MAGLFHSATGFTHENRMHDDALFITVQVKVGVTISACVCLQPRCSEMGTAPAGRGTRSGCFAGLKMYT